MSTHRKPSVRLRRQQAPLRWARILHLPSIRRTWRSLTAQQFREVLPERLQDCQSVGRRIHDFRFGLEHLSAIPFREYAHNFTHAPARGAQNLQTVHAWDEQGDAIVADYADAVGKAVEGLQLESCQVDALELFGGIHRRA